jgi:Family of unknown function (DUF5678)
MPKLATGIAELPNDIPAGAWVAISEKQRKTVAYGADPQSVLKKSREQGEQLPLMIRVPEKNAATFLQAFGLTLSAAAA